MDESAGHVDSPRPWRSVGLPLLILRLAGQGLEFIGFVVLARRLAPGDFGTLSVAFLIARYGGLVGDWGASVRGVRDVAALASPAAVRSLQHRRTLVTLALAGGYVAVALATGHAALVPLAITLVNRGLNRDWYALGRERGLRSGVPQAIQGFLVVGGSLFVSSLGTAAAVLGAAYAVGLFASLVLNPLPTGPSMRRVPVDGWLLAANLADQVTMSTDTVLLAALRSTTQAGIYAAMYRIPNAWLTIIGLIVVGMVPATTRTIARNRTAIRSTAARNWRAGMIAAGLVLLSIPVTILSVTVIFGPAYADGRLPLTLLLVATAVNALAASLHPVYLALAHDRSQAAISCSAAALNVSANIVLIPMFGMTAAAATTLAAQVMLLFAFSRGVLRAAAAAEASEVRPIVTRAAVAAS
jgi:O-antigen/teichoic acid export membrane protein